LRGIRGLDRMIEWAQCQVVMFRLTKMKSIENVQEPNILNEMGENFINVSVYLAIDKLIGDTKIKSITNN